MGRCLRCADRQRQEGKQEEEIVWETYQGETSTSIVSRSREHFEDYKTAMKKPPPQPEDTGGRGRRTGREGPGEDAEE